MWSIAMPRTPKDLADRKAARRRRSLADRSHISASHLIDMKTALPNPFAEVGEQRPSRKREGSGTVRKPAGREL
jgi:hypothetical protein